jgi:hypothetical protein
MVGQITYAMRQINYPSKKIEFFYVVEESDLQTYKALRKALSEALADGIVNEKFLLFLMVSPAQNRAPVIMPLPMQVEIYWFL